MFEKEAKEYAIGNYETCLYDDLPYTDDSRAIEKTFKDAATFGYNKANEEAKDIINELLMNGYDESTRAKAFNFLYPDKE